MTKSAMKKISGRKLAEFRASELALTQDELAAKIGISSGRVSALEQKGGNMLLRNFRKLADVSNLTIDALFDRIGIKSARKSSSPGRADPQGPQVDLSEVGE